MIVGEVAPDSYGKFTPNDVGTLSEPMRPLTKISIFGVRLACCALAVYWLIIFAGTHAPTLPQAASFISDKVLHFSAYFGLAVLLCWVTQTRQRVWIKFGTVIVIALAYAAFDEWTQGFVPGRQSDIKDFSADACGIFAAVGLYSAARYLSVRWFMPDLSSALEVESESSAEMQNGDLHVAASGH